MAGRTGGMEHPPLPLSLSDGVRHWSGRSSTIILPMTNDEKMTKRCTSSASSNCPLHSLDCLWHIIVLSRGVNTFVPQTKKCCIAIRFVEHSLFRICCMAHCFPLHRGIKIPHHHHFTMNIDSNTTTLLCAAAGTAPAPAAAAAPPAASAVPLFQACAAGSFCQIDQRYVNVAKSHHSCFNCEKKLHSALMCGKIWEAVEHIIEER